MKEHLNETQKDTDTTLEFSNSIALKLLREEQAVQQMIEKIRVIAYRSQYGSVNPAAIVGPGIAATAVSTIVAVVFCKIMDGKWRV